MNCFVFTENVCACGMDFLQEGPLTHMKPTRKPPAEAGSIFVICCGKVDLDSLADM